MKKAISRSLKDFAGDLDLHPLIAQVLFQRGYEDVDEAADFLEARLSKLPQPDGMKGAAKAAARIADAMERSESICIYGDYDVDGVTSTALLIDFFRKVGYPVKFRLPSRVDEGYGFHSDAVKELKGQGVDLIVTVDCGISGIDACRAAKELGVTVIITDHHEIIDQLPDAYAVVNPHQEDCGFHDQPLAGVGIAFFVAAAIRKELINRGRISNTDADLKQFIDLVTLGTVADVAPVIGINRVLVNYGLKLIGEGARPGIVALKEVARLNARNILCGHISFQMAPRINAAGRMGLANAGVELLTSQDAQAVRVIAQKLDEENSKRQKVEADILEEARQQLMSNRHYKSLYTIVLAGRDWHPGVIGIVASRIQEEFYRPTILITFDSEENIGRGSARSISGFDLIEIISSCSEHLEGFGGHKYAAGVQIRPDNLMEFAKDFETAARKVLVEDDLIPTLQIDAECDLDLIDMRLIKSISRLAPYGVGNPEPLFITRDAKVEYKRVVGKNHLKLRLGRKRDNISAIAFNMGHLADKINSRIDIAFTAGLNEYQGQTEIQLTVKDLKVVD